MSKPDLKSLAKEVIESVRGFVMRSVANINERIDLLDKRLAEIPAGAQGEQGGQGEPGAPGEDGSQGEPGERGDKGETGDKGDDGENGENGDVGPQGEPGINGKDGTDGSEGEPGSKGEKGDDGARGRDVDMELVNARIITAVAEAFDRMPVPKDGKDGEAGRDGADMDILNGIDETKSYPRGTWSRHAGGLIKAARRTDPINDGPLEDAGWQVIMDGIAGHVITQGDDTREIEIACMLTSGITTISAFTMPTMDYKEIWRAGEYKRGDIVTWSGSAWHCQRPTTDKPGTSDARKLMVKHGAPGKDGKQTKPSTEPVRLK